MTSNLNSIRKKFKPDKTKTIFIGESPPNNGTFFYNEDSNLFHYTLEAFKKAYANMDSDQFLAFFKKKGCYVEDLVSTPINNMANSKRNQKRRENEKNLSAKLSNLKSHLNVIIVVHKGIKNNVISALENTGIPVTLSFHPCAKRDRKMHKRELNGKNGIPCYFLYFPANGHQSTYVRELAKIIKNLKK